MNTNDSYDWSKPCYGCEVVYLHKGYVDKREITGDNSIFKKELNTASFILTCPECGVEYYLTPEQYLRVPIIPQGEK